jgi:hypothetical protein
VKEVGRTPSEVPPTITTYLFHLYKNYYEFMGNGGGPPDPIFLEVSKGSIGGDYRIDCY